MFSLLMLNLLSNLGRQINDNSGDVRETAYLFQRISVTIHCLDFVRSSDCRLTGPIANQLGIFTTWGIK